MTSKLIQAEDAEETADRAKLDKLREEMKSLSRLEELEQAARETLDHIEEKASTDPDRMRKNIAYYLDRFGVTDYPALMDFWDGNTDVIADITVDFMVGMATHKGQYLTMTNALEKLCSLAIEMKNSPSKLWTPGSNPFGPQTW